MSYANSSSCVLEDCHPITNSLNPLEGSLTIQNQVEIFHENVTENVSGHSNYTSLVIRKNREGEVRLAIPLYYLCVVDKYAIDKKTYG